MVTFSNNRREKDREEALKQLTCSGAIYLLSKANQKYDAKNPMLPPPKEAEEVHNQHRVQYTEGLSETEREIFLTRANIDSLNLYQISFSHFFSTMSNTSTLNERIEVSKAELKKRILLSKLARISGKTDQKFDYSLKKNPAALGKCHTQVYKIIRLPRIAVLKEQNQARAALKEELAKHNLSFSDATQTTMLKIALFEAQKKVSDHKFHIALHNLSIDDVTPSEVSPDEYYDKLAEEAEYEYDHIEEDRKAAKEAVKSVLDERNQQNILAVNIGMPGQSKRTETVDKIIAKIAKLRYERLLAIENTYS